MTHLETRPLPANAELGSSTHGAMTYARARLLLGISCVGTIVVLSSVSLMTGVHRREFDSSGSLLSGAGLLAAFVGVYVCVQLPFDLLGGYVLPKRFGRRVPRLSRFLRSLTFGIALHAAVMMLMLLAIRAGAGLAGMLGVLIAVTLCSVILLATRSVVAKLIGSLTDLGAHDHGADDRFGVRVLGSEDEGFTGGIEGVVNPGTILIPARWRDELPGEAFRLSVERRALAIRGGYWIRGRVASIAFVAVGVVISALAGGDDTLPSSAGTIGFSLWFTLWSFLGLLVLPTPSRSAVRAVDKRLLDRRTDERERAVEEDLLRRLDALGDDEPSRSRGIESVFHPIPSTENRLSGSNDAARSLGLWDVARTSLYLGLASGGLLGRAVHCNCGRPSIWVYLPSA